MSKGFVTIFRYPRALPPHFTKLNFPEFFNKIWSLNSLIVLVLFKFLSIRDWYNGKQHNQKIPPLHSGVLSRTFCLFKGVIDTYAGRDSEFNYRKCRCRKITRSWYKSEKESRRLVLPQKFLLEWAESLQIPPEGNVLSLILGCSAQAPSYWERCGRQQDRLWHESLSPDGQDLSWSQSLRLAADPLTAGRNLPLVTWPILEKVRPTF